MKKALIALAVVVLTVCLLVVGRWGYTYWSYSSRLAEERETWINEEFQPMEIKGTIFRLKINNAGRCFSNLIVLTGGQKFSVGVCLCGENKRFAEFTLEGDSIFKQKNEMKIRIKKPSGEFEDFQFPFCSN